MEFVLKVASVLVTIDSLEVLNGHGSIGGMAFIALRRR